MIDDDCVKLNFYNIWAVRFKNNNYRKPMFKFNWI